MSSGLLILFVIMIFILLSPSVFEGYYNPVLSHDILISQHPQSHILLVNGVEQDHITLKNGEFYRFSFHTHDPVYFSTMSCNSVYNQFMDPTIGNVFHQSPTTTGSMNFRADQSIPRQFYIQSEDANRILITKI